MSPPCPLTRPRDLEPEPGALARSLGREEGVEDARLVLQRDAGPIVDHPHRDPAAFVARIHDHLATLANGIQRIVDQVHPHLVQLSADRVNRGQPRLDLDLDADRPGARLVTQDRQRVP